MIPEVKTVNVNNVLLIFPTPKRKHAFLNTLPPLGLLSIASYLESKGIHTDVVDCHVQTLDPDFSKYDVICFAVNIANVENTADYIKEIKEKNGKQKILIGGPQVPHRGEYWIREHNVDAVIIGEGELTVYDYLTSNDPSSVKGVLCKVNEEIIYTGDRQLVMNLDTLPFPALDKVPLRNYNLPIKKGFPVSSISTSRGCPAKCTFCSVREGVWRQRSVKHVVDEIEWQVRKLGVRELWIADDNFTLNRQRAWDIAEEIIKRKIMVKMQLKNGIRVDKVDKELLAKLKEAGVWLIAVAPESGKQETLDRIQKGFTLERVKLVVQFCKELDIKTFAMFILGLPWETNEDIQQTIKFANELDTDFVQFARYTPMEGTPIYDEVRAQGMLSGNEFKDIGTHVDTLNYHPKLLSRDYMQKVFKRAYRSYYLKPRRILNILNMLSFRDLYYTAKFAFASNSM